jgi:hypothetical protein
MFASLFIATPSSFGLTGLERINKLVAVGVIALIVLTAVVLTEFAYLQDESDSSPTPTPTPVPTPTPTTSPAPTATPVPNGGTAANLVCYVDRLDFTTDCGLEFLIYVDIVNTGTQTAYNVSLHIGTWFSNGTKGIDDVVRLNNQVIWILQFVEVDIAGGETCSLKNRYFSALVYSVPGEFWLDEWGEVYPHDLIATYSITPIWSDAP